MTKRNPCTYRIEKYTETGKIEEWTRGYIQDRKTIDGELHYFISPGGESIDELWYKHEDVKLTKGHWTNRSNKVISKKSFWRRAK